jgi:hypothetical protein
MKQHVPTFESFQFEYKAINEQAQELNRIVAILEAEFTFPDDLGYDDLYSGEHEELENARHQRDVTTRRRAGAQKAVETKELYSGQEWQFALAYIKALGEESFYLSDMSQYAPGDTEDWAAAAYPMKLSSFNALVKKMFDLQQGELSDESGGVKYPKVKEYFNKFDQMDVEEIKTQIIAPELEVDSVLDKRKELADDAAIKRDLRILQKVL